MYQYNDKDGLSRQKRREEIEVNQPFRVMEDDFFHLFERVLGNAAFIRYFNFKNTPDGYWKALYNHQPLVVLMEIMFFDTHKKENDFATSKLQEKRKALAHEVEQALEEWIARLKGALSTKTTLLLTHLNYQFEMIAKDIKESREINKMANFHNFKKEASSSEDLISVAFYRRQEAVRTIQNNYTLYLDDIKAGAEVDPSMAIIFAFVKNYAEVVSRYNKRWQKLPEFYLEKILHVRPRASQLWTTWLVLEPDEKAGFICIPARTGFIAGKQPDETPIIYRNEKEHYISQIHLKKVLAYYFKEILLRKDLSVCIDPEDPSRDNPQKLFIKDTECEPISTGIMLESPLLLLREGKRRVYVRFVLMESESDISIPNDLNDAFCPEISTEEGWNAISDYTLTYNKYTNCLDFRFTLPPGSPSTESCKEVHGVVTQAPAIRLLMNPEATHYPYEWMMQYRFKEIRIGVDVSGITTFEIQTVMGPVDPSQPFFPFGAMPEQGSWMIWKNEELARKKVNKVCFTCNWLQLPVSDQGFYDTYKMYSPPLDNSSFKIRKDYLSQNKWCVESTATDNLFSYEAPKGKVKKESSFFWSVGKEAELDGSFRMELTGPAIGFGHTAFRKIFSDCVVQNSYAKKKALPPEVPVTPLMNLPEISYSADEVVRMQPGEDTSIRLYYVHPLMDDCMRDIDLTSPPLLFEGVSNKRNLLFGFSGAKGETFIRFFVDVAPLSMTLNRDDAFRVTWFIQKGPWIWEKLPFEVVYSDSTDDFMQTGLIELQLLEPIEEEWLDEWGLCWICAAFTDKGGNLSPSVFGFYMNVVPVVLDTQLPGFDEKQLPESLPAGSIEASEEILPGILAIRQIVDAYGGCRTESSEDLKIRISNRIRHRNRAILKRDYEELVLSNFDEIGKAYCFVNENSQTNTCESQTWVTLVLVPAVYIKGMYPLCNNSLLWRVEDLIRKHTSPFVKVRARNPFYEEITIRCRIDLVDTDVPRGELKREIQQRVEHCIAPWMEKGESPIFNYSFSIYDMKNEIANSDYILYVSDLVILQRTSYGMEVYHLEKYEANSESKTIQVKYPGNILFPGKNHLVYLSGEVEDGSTVGIEELEIDNTFIID